MPEILIVPQHLFPDRPDAGTWPWTGWPDAEPLWIERATAKQDERYLQFIPYLLLHDAAGAVWCYARRGGDRRLLDRRSCGIGGHVERADQRTELAATLTAALQREAAEELGPEVAELLSGSLPRAWIYEGLSAIGRVHVGLLYTALWPHAEPPEPSEPALESLGFLVPETIRDDQRFELWSRLAVGCLNR
jgi:predicted NUDIX family phosphoesterase